MIEEQITKKINEKFNPVAFFLENESHMHSGPRTESHFKVYLASDLFVDLSRVERQRLINDLMKEEFEAGLHALSMRLRTVEEHSIKGVGDFISPTCASKVKG